MTPAADRRGRYAAAMSSQANLDAVLRLVDAETARLRAELEHRDPDALVSVRRVREWLDDHGAPDGADLSGLRIPLHHAYTIPATPAQVEAHRPTWGLRVPHGPLCLDLIGGDWPIGPRTDIPLTAAGTAALRHRQAAAGLFVDGRLQRQSWYALAAQNQENRP